FKDLSFLQNAAPRALKKPVLSNGTAKVEIIFNPTKLFTKNLSFPGFARNDKERMPPKTCWKNEYFLPFLGGKKAQNFALFS
ncbi:MAG: hypothetical protein J5835_07205, partial [Bacteroidales bacterium]|nr:hypothetical protein [Bacteroidales bacterium]